MMEKQMDEQPDEQPASASWRHNLGIVVGVMATVLMALLLAQLDALQVRWQPTRLVMSPATAVSTPLITQTPLPAIALPSAEPASPTATATAVATPNAAASATAVGVLPEIICGVAPAGWSIYEVRPGDTLLSLAAFSGATVAEISRANCVQNGLVLSGMRIYLPVRPPTRIACGPPTWWTQYVVRSGDTMFALARRHGTTVYAIMQANCLDTTRLIAGRAIYLPPQVVAPPTTGAPTGTATATATTSPTPTSTSSATPTGSPSATAVATTVTITATTTPTASSTPDISITPTPTPSTSPTPSATPETTPTPTPSPTPEPTATPAPSATPSPSPTSEPTATP
jgi:LysM repeat protein